MVDVPFSNRSQHVLRYTISSSNNTGSTIDITWNARVVTSGNINTPYGTGSATHTTSPATSYVSGQTNSTWSVPYDYRPNPNYTLQLGSGTRRVNLGSGTRTFAISVSLGNLIGSASASINYTPPAGTAIVPNVVGSTTGDAQFIISTAGFNPNFLGTTTSGATPSNNGTVASQTPEAGSTLTLGSNVSYTSYNYVPPPTPPPSDPSGLFISNQGITSLTLAWTASSGSVSDYQLTLNGSNVTTTTNTFYTFSGLSANTSYTLGVRARGPGGNSNLVTINAATLPATFTTPNVVGQLRDTAITNLRNAGFATNVGVTNITAGSTAANNRRVISQNPTSGTIATAGDPASINVHDFRLAVPNLLGQTENQANNTLSDSGFLFRTSSLTTTGATVANNLTVATQNPSGGTQLNIAETVSYQLFNFLTQVPNVVGQRQDDALTTLNGLGFTNVTVNLDLVGATTQNVGTVKAQTPVNSPTTFNPKSTSVTLTVYSLGVTGKRYTGTSFSALTTAKRFNGTSWVEMTVQKRFDGSVWRDVAN